MEITVINMEISKNKFIGLLTKTYKIQWSVQTVKYSFSKFHKTSLN